MHERGLLKLVNDNERTEVNEEGSERQRRETRLKMKGCRENKGLPWRQAPIGPRKRGCRPRMCMPSTCSDPACVCQ